MQSTPAGRLSSVFRTSRESAARSHTTSFAAAGPSGGRPAARGGAARDPAAAYVLEPWDPLLESVAETTPHTTSSTEAMQAGPSPSQFTATLRYLKLRLEHCVAHRDIVSLKERLNEDDPFFRLIPEDQVRALREWQDGGAGALPPPPAAVVALLQSSAAQALHLHHAEGAAEVDHQRARLSVLEELALGSGAEVEGRVGIQPLDAEHIERDDADVREGGNGPAPEPLPTSKAEAVVTGARRKKVLPQVVVGTKDGGAPAKKPQQAQQHKTSSSSPPLRTGPSSASRTLLPSSSALLQTSCSTDTRTAQPDASCGRLSAATTDDVSSTAVSTTQALLLGLATARPSALTVLLIFHQFEASARGELLVMESHQRLAMVSAYHGTLVQLERRQREQTILRLERQLALHETERKASDHAQGLSLIDSEARQRKMFEERWLHDATALVQEWGSCVVAAQTRLDRSRLVTLLEARERECRQSIVHDRNVSHLELVARCHRHPPQVFVEVASRPPHGVANEMTLEGGAASAVMEAVRAATAPFATKSGPPVDTLPAITAVEEVFLSIDEQLEKRRRCYHERSVRKMKSAEEDTEDCLIDSDDDAITSPYLQRGAAVAGCFHGDVEEGEGNHGSADDDGDVGTSDDDGGVHNSSEQEAIPMQPLMESAAEVAPAPAEGTPRVSSLDSLLASVMKKRFVDTSHTQPNRRRSHRSPPSNARTEVGAMDVERPASEFPHQRTVHATSAPPAAPVTILIETSDDLSPTGTSGSNNNSSASPNGPQDLLEPSTMVPLAVREDAVDKHTDGRVSEDGQNVSAHQRYPLRRAPSRATAASPPSAQPHYTKGTVASGAAAARPATVSVIRETEAYLNLSTPERRPSTAAAVASPNVPTPTRGASLAKAAKAPSSLAKNSSSVAPQSARNATSKPKTAAKLTTTMRIPQVGTVSNPAGNGAISPTDGVRTAHAYYRGVTTLLAPATITNMVADDDPQQQHPPFKNRPGGAPPSASEEKHGDAFMSFVDDTTTPGELDDVLPKWRPRECGEESIEQEVVCHIRQYRSNVAQHLRAMSVSGAASAGHDGARNPPTSSKGAAPWPTTAPFPVMHGWMLKGSGVHMSWQRRYFFLNRSGRLMVSSNPDPFRQPTGGGGCGSPGGVADTCSSSSSLRSASAAAPIPPRRSVSFGPSPFTASSSAFIKWDVCIRVEDIVRVEDDSTAGGARLPPDHDLSNCFHCDVAVHCGPSLTDVSLKRIRFCCFSRKDRNGWIDGLRRARQAVMTLEARGVVEPSPLTKLLCVSRPELLGEIVLSEDDGGGSSASTDSDQFRGGEERTVACKEK